MTLYPLSYGPLPVRRDLNPRHSRWMEFLRHSSRPDISPNRSEGRVKARDRRSPKEWSPMPHSLRPVRAVVAFASGLGVRTRRPGFEFAGRRHPGHPDRVIRMPGGREAARESKPGGRVRSGDYGPWSDGVPGGIPPGLFGPAGRTRRGLVDGRPAVRISRPAGAGRFGSDGRPLSPGGWERGRRDRRGSRAAGLGKSGSGGRVDTLGLWIVRSDGVPGSIPPGRPPCRADPAGACRWPDRPGDAGRSAQLADAGGVFGWSGRSASAGRVRAWSPRSRGPSGRRRNGPP